MRWHALGPISRRQPPAAPDRPHVRDGAQGFIETDDGATVIFDYKGYGRSYPTGRRQVVGAAKHVSDHEKYRWLNDSICVIAGEVRSPNKPTGDIRQGDKELVFDVSELVWEAPHD